LEQEILNWTILVKIRYQKDGHERCDVGTRVFCEAFGHGTVFDERTLVTHNHWSFLEMEGVQVADIETFRAGGTPVANDGVIDVIGYEMSRGRLAQTLLFQFSPGTFFGITPPEFVSSGDMPTSNFSWGDYVQHEDEVAIINWDGSNVGSTCVNWSTVHWTRMRDSVRTISVWGGVEGGASGGGLFTKDLEHIGTSWYRSRGCWLTQPCYRTFAAFNPF
jgi:hypothetical protein